MREITFRGKTYDGMWIEGAYYHADKNYGDPDDVHCIIPTTESLDYEQALEYFIVDPSTVGQYTGLKDKNGKRIFEGDIVEHHAQGDIVVNRGVVNWDVKNARWAHQLTTMNPDFTFFKPDAYEVIGNIHDNPELMEVR